MEIDGLMRLRLVAVDPAERRAAVRAILGILA